jgi:tRNA(fMet)-specific endonuclease VapC
MILLDTDHLSVVANRRASGYAPLMARLQASAEMPLATTIVSVEEQCRGWLAKINRTRSIHNQIPAYEQLANLFSFLSDWEIVPLDTRAADEFERLRKQRLRIGTQDLKIAAIALTKDALLLSANLRDFRQVAELRVESWLE